MKRACTMVLFFLLVSTVQPASGAKLVVSNDDWIFSSLGFSRCSDTDQFADNVFTYLAGEAGRVHAYTTHFGVTQSSFVTWMSSMGFDYTFGTGFPLTSENVGDFDALILTSRDFSADELQVIFDFIDAGGGLYVYGGTSSNPGPVADRLNPVIEPYGVHMERNLNNLSGCVAVTSGTDPIFEGVASLLHDRGNPLTGPFVQVPYGPPGEGLFAVVRNGAGSVCSACGLESAGVVRLYPGSPNPFNPSTDIRFDLPEATSVRLVVYDCTGRVVSSLFEGALPAGEHRVTFDGSGLESGRYFYRLETASFTVTRSMTLIK